MTWRVVIAPSAARALAKRDPQARRRVQAAIELLCDDPRPPTAARLVGGSGMWRVRTAGFRVIYEIHDGQILVLVLTVGHRREVYRRFR